MGWEEVSFGCVFVGSVDVVVLVLVLKGGVIVYCYYCFVVGYDFIIVFIVVDYFFEDWSGLVFIEGGDVYVVCSFDVVFLFYIYLGIVCEFVICVKDVFFGIIDRF